MKSKIEIERAKNEIYKTIFDSAYQAILIIDTENNFQIIDVNKQTLDMFDYTFEEITSLTIFDLSANPELTKIRLDSGVTETILSWYKKKMVINFQSEELSQKSISMEDFLLL